MLDDVKKLLTAGIDGPVLVSEIAEHFYETILDQKKDHPVFYERLSQYETMEEYLGMDTSALSYDEKLIAGDLKDDIEYELQYQFDKVEDSVKSELIHGDSSREVLYEMKKKGIIPRHPENPASYLTEDSVEEFYLEAFQQFDMLRSNLYKRILASSAKDFYQQGEDKSNTYRKEHHLLMDERDFLNYYTENFDKERLWEILSRKIYQTIHYNSRYKMEDLNEEEDDREEGSTPLVDDDDAEDAYGQPDPNQPSEDDIVLIPDGDMSPDDYTYVYELMNEYTGHRVLPTDDDRVTEAYWSVYQDEFGDLLTLYMIQVLEDTINYFSTQQEIKYDSLARFYHWNQEQRKAPSYILSTSDKISYALSDLQEKLWSDFSDSELMPLYEKGRKIEEIGRLSEKKKENQ